MSETKTKKSVGVSFAAIITALLLIISCIAACVVINSGGSPAANAASAALDDATKSVTNFVDDSVRLEADYYDNIFKKVNTAVVMYQGKNDNGELEKICSAAGADLILITDAKGKITQAYPDEKIVGKTLKENKMNAFGKITKGIVDKITTDPEKTDEGYKINVGIRRQDSDGVLVLGVTDDSYAAVAGETLADSCGNNTVVEKDGKIISTNFAPLRLLKRKQRKPATPLTESITKLKRVTPRATPLWLPLPTPAQATQPRLSSSLLQTLYLF